MRKFKTKLYQWRLRLTVAWRVITWKQKHFVMLSMDDKQFTNVVAESLFANEYYQKDIQFTYVGMCEIHAYQALLFALGTFDQNELPLMRAAFQADVDESMLNANRDADGKR